MKMSLTKLPPQRKTKEAQERAEAEKKEASALYVPFSKLPDGLFPKRTFDRIIHDALAENTSYARVQFQEISDRLFSDALDSGAIWQERTVGIDQAYNPVAAFDADRTKKILIPK